MTVNSDVLLQCFELQGALVCVALVSLCCYFLCAIVDFFFCVFMINWHSPFGLKSRRNKSDENN